MPRCRMLMRAPISHTEHGESPNLSFTHRALIVLAALTLAAFISVGCGSGSPQPSPTPATAPTTIVVISTPEPDVTPEPAATVAPQPTVTPAPTPTIPPTLTPEPSPTVSPTPVASPTPASTPEPTPAPTPEATPEPGLTPPIAGERPHSYTHHGITVEDPWHWLEDEDYPTVDDEDVLSLFGSGKRLFRRQHGALPGPDRHHLRGDRGPSAGGTDQSAPAAGGLVLPVALQRGKPVPRVAALARIRSRCPGGSHRERPGGPGRANAGSGSGILPPRFPVGEQRRFPGSLQHRHQRCGKVHHGGQGPGDRGVA